MAADPGAPKPAEPKPAEPRSTDLIRREISDERQKLTRSLTDLREDVQSARRIPLIIGGALLAGLVSFAAVRAARNRDE